MSDNREVSLVEIDTTLLVPAALGGLVEYKDDCWQATPLGEKVIRDYCDKVRSKNA